MLKEIKGEEAKKLVKKCPVKVFDIEDLGNGIRFINLSDCYVLLCLGGANHTQIQIDVECSDKFKPRAQMF